MKKPIFRVWNSEPLDFKKDIRDDNPCALFDDMPILSPYEAMLRLKAGGDIRQYERQKQFGLQEDCDDKLDSVDVYKQYVARKTEFYKQQVAKYNESVKQEQEKQKQDEAVKAKSES